MSKIKCKFNAKPRTSLTLSRKDKKDKKDKKDSSQFVGIAHDLS